MATQAEQLILRGLHLLIRTTFSPNKPDEQARHFVALQNDIGPWLTDYVTEMSKETEFTVVDHISIDGGGGGLQQ